MTNMKPLFKISVHAIIFCALMVIGSALLWFAPGDYNHDIAALINKRDMLAATGGPRIILIGGSNLATLDSRAIQYEIVRGKKINYAIINMSLWAGLSIKRYLEELKPYLKYGDLLIICQEYAPLLDPDFYAFIQKSEDAERFFFLMSPGKLIEQNIHRGNYLTIIKNAVVLNQLKIKTYLLMLIDGNATHRFTGGFYRYNKEYNECGDRIRPFKIIRPLNSRGVQFRGLEVKNLSYLKDFAKWSGLRNIRVYMAFPPFPESEYSLNKNKIDALATIISGMPGLTLLDRPTDAIFPEDCFADTVYHLQPKCERLRTARLAKQLNRLLFN